MSTHLTIHAHYPSPALNVPRRQESLATDTIYTNILDADCGHTRAQFYCEVDLQVCDVYGMRTDE